MRHLLFSLALLPAAVLAHDHRDHEHDSLQPHVHGEAQLDVALEGQLLELQLHSPAMNFVGFERAPANAREQARLNAVRDFLARPDQALGLPAEARCQLERQAVTSDLFGVVAGDADHLALHEEDPEAEPIDDHHDIHAFYQFTCSRPQALQTVSLQGLFRQYPDLRALDVQLIGPGGQKGLTLNARNPILRF